MENLKVRVNNEAESKEVQELFDSLWLLNRSWSCFKFPKLISNHIFGEYSDYLLTDAGINHYKELTIPQLRDMVILKRNDINDATHETREGLKLYFNSTHDVFYKAYKSSINHAMRWTPCELSILDVKPIEKPMQNILDTGENVMKEFLVKHNDVWTLQLLDADTEENSYRVAVPSGAEYMTMPNYYFWKDGDLNHSWSIIEQKWTGNKGESIQEYLKTSYSASIVWQRQETKEFLNSKASYVLQVLPAHAGDDPESGLIEVPVLANYAYKNDQGVLFLNGELGLNHPLLLWKRHTQPEELPFVDDEPKDNVNHPNHYTQGGIECIDALESATIGKQGIEAVCTANIIKYLWRYEEKNGLEDVKKAQWYLNRLIKHLEK